jgi:hypothetical protein
MTKMQQFRVVVYDWNDETKKKDIISHGRAFGSRELAQKDAQRIRQEMEKTQRWYSRGNNTPDRIAMSAHDWREYWTRIIEVEQTQ